MKHMEGYTRLLHYLEEYYRQTGAASAGALLGGMVILSDGSTVDPAYGEDWERALRQAEEEGLHGDITLHAARIFLSKQLVTLDDRDISDALARLSESMQIITGCDTE